MDKRDLKADLKIARSMKPINTAEYYEGIHPRTYQEHTEAREGWLYAIERAIEAEGFVNELLRVLEDVASVLASQVAYAQKDLIGLTRDDRALWASDILRESGQIVAKAKEVLGDE